MAGFTETQKKELGAMLDAALQKARADVCGCRISDEMKQEMPHVEQSFRAIGEGKLDRGVERFRANEEMMTQFRQGKRDTMKAVVKWAGIGLAIFTVCSLWRGIAAKITGLINAGGV